MIFSETQFNTYLYELAVEQFGADWVMYLDADEFIDARGIEDLRSFLAEIPAEHASVGLRMVNYDLPSPGTLDELNVVKRFARRIAQPIEACKVIVRGNLGAGRVTVDAGNHHMFIDGKRQTPMPQLDVLLAHFPVRSPFHWAGKTVTGRLKVLAAGELEVRQNRAFHYIDTVDRLKADPEGWCRKAVAGYAKRVASDDLVHDPIAYLGGELRYTVRVDYGWRAVRLALANMEKLAIAFGGLLDRHTAVRQQVYRDIDSVRLVAGDVTLPQRTTTRHAGIDARLDRPETRSYRRTTLDDLGAERIAWLPASSLDVPPLAFGDLAEGLNGVAFTPPGSAAVGRLERAATPAYIVRNATVHGASGIVTVDDRVVDDPLMNFAVRAIEGAEWADDRQTLQLPILPVTSALHSAYRAFPGDLTNYYHWIIDGLARFRPETFDAFDSHPDTPALPQLLLPALDVYWKWESVRLQVPRRVPRFTVPPEGRVAVQRLLYLPALDGPEFNPHPALLDAFNTIRAGVMGGGALPAPDTAAVHLARRQSEPRARQRKRSHRPRRARRLHAGAAQQIVGARSGAAVRRGVAILAPHGAGLTNIGFCQSGAALCELHMDSYVHAAYRRLATLRGVRYGCLVGHTLPRYPLSLNGGTWRIDVEALDAVLKDSRFLGS